MNYAAPGSDIAAILVVAAAVFAGVLGGVYVAFSVMALPALRDRPAAEAVAVMQRINVVAVRAPFMLVFFGSALTGVAVVIVELLTGRYSLALVGGVLAVAAFLVTLVRNVPLNEALAGNARDDDDDAGWQRFEPRWRRANHLRAAFAIGATIALIVSLA